MAGGMLPLEAAPLVNPAGMVMAPIIMPAAGGRRLLSGPACCCSLALLRAATSCCRQLLAAQAHELPCLFDKHGAGLWGAAALGPAPQLPGP